MQFFHNRPPQSYLHSDAPASDGEKKERRKRRRKKKQELLTELGDAGYVESLHELGPNLRSETIAEHDANLVLPFFRHRCRR